MQLQEKEVEALVLILDHDLVPDLDRAKKESRAIINIVYL
jgi:hypothetical protein